MAAAKIKLAIEQGATLRKRHIWKTGAPPVPVDLTGYTARMQIRPEVGSDTIIHELTTENGGITLGAEPGAIELHISATDTAAFTFESAVYDLEMIAPGGDVIRLFGGSVGLSKEVTR